MLEAVKPIPLADSDASSTQTGEDLLFEKFDLGDLQCSVCIFFYFHEFMEGVKTIFQDAQQKSSNLDLDEECSVITIYTAACNFMQRLKQSSSPLPTVENILESLIYDTALEDKLSDAPLVLSDDIVPDLTGTISYRKF